MLGQARISTFSVIVSGSTASSVVVHVIFLPIGGMVKSVIKFCFGIVILSAVVQ
jgi:hypothetical protein